MRDRCAALLLCPVCGACLRLAGRSLVCQRSHSFEVARPGYVNLLLAHGRLPRAMGDSREMVLSRRRFLERGHYEPLARYVDRLVRDALRDYMPAIEDEETYVVDVGAGNGYYLDHVKGSLEHAGFPSLCYFGVDLSKEAARLASRMYPDLWFVVADVKRQLPVRSGAAIAVLNIFAPRNADEFRRVIHPRGLLLVVLPEADHLAELIERFGLIEVHPGKEEHVMRQLGDAFDLAQKEELRFSMDLRAEEMRDLVAMGPSARHLNPKDLLDKVGSETVSATASFVILVLRPKGQEHGVRTARRAATAQGREG